MVRVRGVGQPLGCQLRLARCNRHTIHPLSCAAAADRYRRDFCHDLTVHCHSIEPALHGWCPDSAAVLYDEPIMLLQAARAAACGLAQKCCHVRTVSSVVDLISGSTVSEHTSDLQQVARDFARQQLAPHGAVWDKEEIFPVDVLKQAAELGFAGLFVDEQYGGCGLSRSDGKDECNRCVKHAAAQGHQPRQCAPAGVVIFEALSYGDVPTTAYLTIHNMVAGVLNRWGRHAQHNVLVPSPTADSHAASLSALDV